MTVIVQAFQKTLTMLGKIEWLPPLLVRLVVGYVFFMSGKGKLEHLDNTTLFFANLGIPYPAFNAVLVAVTETVGGALLIIGMATRVACVPLAVVMVVALAKAIGPEAGGVDNLIGAGEVIYLLIFLGMITTGPGRASIDHLIQKKLDSDATRLGKPPGNPA